MRFLDRRGFLRGMALSLPALLARNSFGDVAPAVLQASAPQRSLFESIPPSISGIDFRHSNGRSAEYYLPETTGAGCAFLDYDNDGWMDIYLVNSGRCDFYEPDPPLRNALYHNNRDGTFTDVTEKAGVAGGGTAWASPSATTTATASPTSTSRNMAAASCITTTATAPSPTSPQKPASPLPAGPPAPSGSTTTTMAGSTCSSAASSTSTNRRTVSAATSETGKRYYCMPNVYKPMPQLALPQQRRRHFHRRQQGIGHREVARQSLGSGRRRHQQRRLAWICSSPTTPSRIFSSSIAARANLKRSASAGVAYSAYGLARSGMGVDAADYDQDGWHDLFVANVDQEIYSLYHNNQDQTFDDIAVPTGIGLRPRLMSGWGLKFFDYDNDGNLDLFLATATRTTRSKNTPPAGEISSSRCCFSPEQGRRIGQCQ